MTAPERGAGRSWQTVQDLLSVLGPITVVTGLLYYFGRASTQTFFSWFGVPLSVLDISTAGYVTGTADTVFRPLATVLIAAVVLFLLHPLLQGLLTGLTADGRRRTTLVLLAVCVVLAGFSLLGLYSGRLKLAAALALVSAALLFEYSVRTASPDTPLLPAAWLSAAPIRVGLVTCLVITGLFWAVTLQAHTRGEHNARLVEGALLAMPQAVVYSDKDLRLTGPGVDITRLRGGNSNYHFRYNGLRPLVHANGRWFLLPAGWTKDSGATVIVVHDAPDAVRVDLAPGRYPLPG
ncbi:hypothetical protein [Actinoplanes sp. NPDC023714]|uniref:hypothetical protein n=1 Tax=Actinoplanes sp. NPDC023714 TaxID=3154322 RepID=UPI0033C6704A